ncbi:hypothetical protein ABAC460_06615 [Asticcacaulis sp. AC460]|uniref:TonB-dependent receptor n=1 Tax=Asticcacaulis sp. AC460 TaxID=1282360 RepID=UPI0003C3D670|nr:TonB-dependent receptor [Asticcacaulis sp. AC460]ESQ91231.1 hypothetical protein ABAC460_06615 [Asticcacaulis sp. AC460]
MKISKGKGLTGLMLKGGVSALALTAFTAVAATPVAAQDAPAATSGDEVVVVGVRRSLKTAQQIKKDADTVVDSITANDIGSFPDKSVAEALQRVAGITVNRFAATGDTAHFSAEPSGVVVRGLQQVRSEFNGRDIFTADSSRGLSWSDVSPELMGGVDTYKNQTAELIEGGIAGTINLRTRLPFDQKGRVLAATGEYTYGDLVKDGRMSFSGIYADRWEIDGGEVGLMLNFAHGETSTNSEGVQYGRIVPVETSYWGAGRRYIPVSTAFRDNIYDRTRDGIAIAAQWQNADKTMAATLQYNQSKKVEQWEEYVATASTGADAWARDINFVSTDGNIQCLNAASNCKFNSDGMFESGVLVGGNGAWYGAWQAPAGATTPAGWTNARSCYSWECGSDTPQQRSPGYANDTRWSDSLNDTKDISLNFKWDPTDRLKLNFDVQHVDAIQENYDISTSLATYAAVNLDASGSHPTMEILDTVPGWYMAGATGAERIANPNNYRQHFLMDHVTDSEGEEFATRADLAYSFDSPWLNTLKAGVRYANREQTIRWTTYNWASVVNNWSNYDRNNYYITGSEFPDQGAHGIYTFDPNFYGGGTTNAADGVFFNIDYLKDREGLATTFDRTHYTPSYTDGTASNQWTPICHRTGEIDGCFRAAELASVKEETKAAYVQLKFGGPDATIFGGITVTGNIGLRYVETLNESTGGVNYPSSAPVYDWQPLSETAPGSGVYRASLSYYVDGLIGTPPAVTANQTTDPTLYAQQAAAASAYVNNPANWTGDRKFIGSQNATLETASVVHKNWLPSFNVRLGLTDTWFLRFAASRAMSRPDIGNLKKYSSVGMSLPSTTNSSFACNVPNSAFECTPGGQIIKTKVTFTGSANNPYLKPVTADQFDLSVENYFSSTGSFTFNLFYKKFHDYIQFGNYYTDFTNQGVTRSVRMSGPVNGDGAAIRGFEITYTTFFDELPAPFNGFGIQTNYTHLANDGIKSSNVVTNSGDGSSGQTGGGTSVAALSYTDLPLEGLSEDSFNLIGMYEKGAWSARVAYNWRSEYLVTAQDCCIAFPIWQEAQGFLDARLAYRFNDHVEVSIEGSNLLSTETVLKQQVDGPMSDGTNRERLLLPAAWFKNDRRLQASVRWKY